jgi:ABC-type transport system involved in multi-copper enzyme maturation permease subunit
MITNLVLALFGPLAGPECRRALGRGWLIMVRTLAATALALVAVTVVWTWWLCIGLDPLFTPWFELRIALAIAAMIVLTIAVVMAPAVLAGSLAGERERGVLLLLLTTEVNSAEVVLGRMAGKLSQVGMVLLAGLPPLSLLAGWSGLGLGHILAMLLLLLAVVVGGGGMGTCASVFSRRGRDALLGVYLAILLLLLAPLGTRLGLPYELDDWIAPLNPYVSMTRLTWDGQTQPAVTTAAAWLCLGLLGTAAAAWRLRPSCIAAGQIVRSTSRRNRVAAVTERPMLWKELHIERAGNVGRIARWLGWLLTIPAIGVSLSLSAVFGWALLWRRDVELSVWATDQFAILLRTTSVFLGWLLQWGIGLRSSVAVAAERENGTWDALLVSPLESAEIVRAKLAGSLYGMRWILGSFVLCWTLGLVVGAASFGQYAGWIIGNACSCLLMAAIGIRCSLSLPTATKAMTWTIAGWLVAAAIVPLTALAIIAFGMLCFVALWTLWIQLALIPVNSRPWFPMSWPMAWAITTNAITLLATFLIVLETRLRFDRLAGRMSGTIEAPKPIAEGQDSTVADAEVSEAQVEAGISS